MITNISANSPDFQARLKVKRKIPRELTELLENTADIFPKDYTIKVKNNWILDSITNSGEPIKKGNFDVSLYKKTNMLKKEKINTKSYSWIVYQKKKGNNFLDIAIQIYENLFNLKDKMLKKV